MLKLDSVRVDLGAQRDGQWQPAPGWKGVSFLVRSLQYEPYKTARDAALERLSAQYVGAIPDDIWLPVLGGLIAEHILLDWKGFADDYDEDLAAKLLPDPAWQQLREKVLVAATKVGIRELEFVTALEKNSARSSDIN